MQKNQNFLRAWKLGVGATISDSITNNRQVFLTLAPRALPPNATQSRPPRPGVRMFSRVRMFSIVMMPAIHVTLHVMMPAIHVTARVMVTCMFSRVMMPAIHVTLHVMVSWVAAVQSKGPLSVILRMELDIVVSVRNGMRLL